MKMQKLIFEKRETWFESNLEETDIESAFNSTIRIYKSGKFYLLRTNIKNNHQNLPSIKIYNEQEIPLTIDDITSETNLITILEIQGIKFTTRNFQIEIELKQAMVLDNEPLFDNCLIKPNKKVIEESVTLANTNTFKKQEELTQSFSLEHDKEVNNLTSLNEINDLDSDSVINNLDSDLVIKDDKDDTELSEKEIFVETDTFETDTFETNEPLELEIEDLV
jgi:hypothetical protein